MANLEFNPIRLVVFDWAGTTIDFGSCAPAEAFRAVFAAHGVQVTDAEARAPMGTNKRDHLISMLQGERVGQLWESVHGIPWSDRDVDAMYEEFMPFQMAALTASSSLVPGLLPVVERLRSGGCQIGCNTGYFRDAALTVAQRAAEAGFEPDTNVCADDVPQGRPAPWMIYRVMQRLGVYPAPTVVNVGDTIADIRAGVAAGCWSVGVCDSSSLVGLSLSAFDALPESEKNQAIQNARQTFLDAGAHAVIKSISELPPLIETLNQNQYSQPHVIE